MSESTEAKPCLVRWHDCEQGRYVHAADLLTAGLRYIDLRPANESATIAGLLAWLAPILGE